jgi:UDP-N-acetylglucosamine 2-epimerase (non-hydrolysing)
MKILIVVGTRPNFMKAASIIAAIQTYNSRIAEADEALKIAHVLVHTGQHYDDQMSGSFFSDLDLPAPDIMLEVGSGSHAFQTAEILTKFEAVLLSERPDVVVVTGDVNSTMACALVTAKIAFDPTGRRPLLAHVESGLRSFDRVMPEEVNRVVTDHVSDLLLVSEENGIYNLQAEGIAPEAIHFVGNTMIDSLLRFKDRAESSDILQRLGLCPPAINCSRRSVTRYALLTLHRPSNVDNLATLRELIGGLEDLSKQCPIIFPVHPRTRNRIAEFGFGANPGFGGIRTPADDVGFMFTGPLGYLDFVCLMKHAAIVITDSGGIQEETTCLGIPCVTLRENTERPVTVTQGTNVVAGTEKGGVRDAIRRQMGRVVVGCTPEKWDGQAGTRIIDVLTSAVSAEKCGSPVSCGTAPSSQCSRSSTPESSPVAHTSARIRRPPRYNTSTVCPSEATSSA